MLEKVKEVTISTIKNEWAKEPKLDIVSSAANLYMKITFICLLGKGDEELRIR